MASSLFSQQPQSNGGIFSRLNQIKGILGGDPQVMYNFMMQRNPQLAELIRDNQSKFVEFVQNNQGKSPDQIAAENGVNMNTARFFYNKFFGS